MHDMNGTLVKVGDRVLLPCIVKEVSAGEEFCNCSLISCVPRRPDGAYENINAINTGCLVVVSTGEAYMGV